MRDPASQRLEIRGLTECPTCHRPLRSSSPERQYDTPNYHDSYVDPGYFRMLQAGHDDHEGGHEHDHDGDIRVRPGHTPSSPRRRPVQPAQPVQGGVTDAGRIGDEAEFVSSAPRVQEGSRIRREAFSPNYFKTFFVEESELGRGGKGVVLLVRHEIDGCHLGYFACKRVPVGDDHAWLEKVLVEVELLAKLSHPNLVSYRHVWLEDVKLNRFGPSVACAFILQQYCNSGDLLRHVIGDQPREATKEELKAQMRRRSKGGGPGGERPQDLFAGQRQLPFEEIYSLFRDITSGLAYLHAANYTHRDLKPSNCLLHREGRTLVCLISDFGEVQPENMVRKSTGSTGTISYCAPEVLRRDAAGRYGNFTTKSDIFSLGMILYFMCFGRLPYQAANSVHEELEDIDALRAEITDWKGFHDERRERPDLPSKLYQLLKKLLALNPAERPGANEVLSAMKSESGLDGITRAAGPRSASPPVGVRGRRIQNLDSPVPPSTPVPEPTKQAHAASPTRDGINGSPSSSRDEASPQPGSYNSLQRHSAPRHRATAMAASRSQEAYTREVDETAVAASGGSRLPSPADTPLLMAPPTTFLGEAQHTILLVHHRALSILQQNHESVTFLLRLLLFLAKMASLIRPCWPYTVEPGIGAFLIIAAGLDLGGPGSQAVRMRAWDNGVNHNHHDRQPSTGLAIAFAAPPVDNGRWRWWGWRASLGLVALHFAVLWTASRRGVLCAVPREEWVAW